jgi:hypothetical protein
MVGNGFLVTILHSRVMAAGRRTREGRGGDHADGARAWPRGEPRLVWEKITG